jgi:hypothetical protein
VRTYTHARTHTHNHTITRSRTAPTLPPAIPVWQVFQSDTPGVLVVLQEVGCYDEVLAMVGGLTVGNVWGWVGVWVCL